MFSFKKSKEIAIILGVYLLFLWFVLLIGSCNPVKQVLKDNQKFEIVAKEVVKRGYCINDTVIVDTGHIEIVHDTTRKVDSFKLGGTYQNIDTILPSGARVNILDDFLFVECPEAVTTTQTLHKTAFIRDLKLESILKEEIVVKDDSIKNLIFSVRDKELVAKEAEAKLKSAIFRFWVLIALLVLAAAVKLYLKFKP
jgi:hypothetical protein